MDYIMLNGNDNNVTHNNNNHNNKDLFVQAAPVTPINKKNNVDKSNSLLHINGNNDISLKNKCVYNIDIPSILLFIRGSLAFVGMVVCWLGLWYILNLYVQPSDVLRNIMYTFG